MPQNRILATNVNDLINPINGAWDEELVKTLFWPVDAQRILQIPTRAGREDVVAWHHNRNGMFSVRSAYHVQWNYRYGSWEGEAVAGNVGDNQTWKKLLNLRVPAKIKIFGCRALQCLIPCRGVLANKHIGNNSTCPLCQRGCEDIKHMMFQCEQAQEVWTALGIWGCIQDILAIDRSGSVIMEEVIRIGGQVNGLNNVGFA